jgi:hypothetical protein
MKCERSLRHAIERLKRGGGEARIWSNTDRLQTGKPRLSAPMIALRLSAGHL